MTPSALVCVAAALLVATVAGDVATLIYGHYRGAPGKKGETWLAGAQTLAGGALLASAVLLLVVACIVPGRASALCKLWLTVHATYADDWGAAAKDMLYALQVQPVVDAMGLSSVEHAAYWWWLVQGCFMNGLVLLAAGHGAEEELEDEEVVGDEEDDDMATELIGDAQPPPLALEAPNCQLAIEPTDPSPPRAATLIIEEIQ